MVTIVKCKCWVSGSLLTASISGALTRRQTAPEDESTETWDRLLLTQETGGWGIQLGTQRLVSATASPGLELQSLEPLSQKKKKKGSLSKVETTACFGGERALEPHGSSTCCGDALRGRKREETPASPFHSSSSLLLVLPLHQAHCTITMKPFGGQPPATWRREGEGRVSSIWGG